MSLGDFDFVRSIYIGIVMFFVLVLVLFWFCVFLEGKEFRRYFCVCKFLLCLSFGDDYDMLSFKFGFCLNSMLDFCKVY